MPKENQSIIDKFMKNYKLHNEIAVIGHIIGFVLSAVLLFYMIVFNHYANPVYIVLFIIVVTLSVAMYAYSKENKETMEDFMLFYKMQKLLTKKKK